MKRTRKIAVAVAGVAFAAAGVMVWLKGMTWALGLLFQTGAS